MAESYISIFAEELGKPPYIGADYTERDRLAERMDEVRRKHPKVNFRVKKIVWDEEGGYPEHAWGYTQYTIRPYVQGMGCDGTTTENILLLAKILCDRQGLDYLEVMNRAYPEEEGYSKHDTAWMPGFRHETIVPEEIDPHLLIEDLHDINYHSFARELEEETERLGIHLTNYGEAPFMCPVHGDGSVYAVMTATVKCAVDRWGSIPEEHDVGTEEEEILYAECRLCERVIQDY